MTTVKDLMGTLREIVNLESYSGFVPRKKEALDEKEKKAENQLNEIIDERIRQYFSADGK